MTTLSDIDLLEQKMLYECEDDFLAFRKFLHPKMKLGWFVHDMSKQLQWFYDELVAGRRPKMAVCTPPQFGKSIAVVDFIAWVAGKRPDMRTIFASFSERLGTRANLMLQRTYDSAKYKKVFQETKISTVGSPNSFGATRNRELLEYIDHTGYFRNTTTMGAVTGESADLIVIDDPFKGRAEVNSPTIREKTLAWYTDDLSTRCSEDSGTLIVNTRWHTADLVGKLKELEGDGFKIVNYEAIAKTDEKHRKKGESLFPEHKSLDFLLAIKSVMAVSSWESLYQGSPFVAEGNFYKPDFIGVIDAIPAGTTFCRAWDFAATDGGGDWTVGLKIGKMPDGRTLVADIVREQVGPEKVRALLKTTTTRDGNRVKVRIPQDPGQAGKAQAKSMTADLAGFTVVALIVSGEKSIRAEPFASQVNVGNVVMLRASWNDAFVEELRPFPNGVHDDQSDAAADAYNELFGGGCGADSLLEALRRQYEAQQAANK